MTKVTVSRDNNKLPTMARNKVEGTVLFRLVKRDGSKGNTLYAHLSDSTKRKRFYSVNTTNGELAGSSKGDKQVAITGEYKIKVKLFETSKRYTTTRDKVPASHAFQVFNSAGAKAGDTPSIYAHAGIIEDDTYLSVNLNTKNVSTTENGSGKVTVVGVWEIEGVSA